MMTDTEKFEEIARLGEQTKKTIEELSGQLIELITENAALKKELFILKNPPA